MREELRGLLARLLADEPRDYSSRRGCGPAGYADRVWKTLAKQLGVKRGRFWVVTRTQLETYEAAQRAPASSVTVPAANDTAADPAWSPSAALEAAGLRRTR